MTPDDVDRRIIAALLADGRASVEELGDAADVSSSTAAWRKEVLENADVIRGYEPRLDYRALGYDLVAIFRIDLSPEARELATAALCDHPPFHTVYEATDPLDVVAIGRFADRTTLDETLKWLRGDARFASVSADIADPHKEYEWFCPE